MAASHFSKAIGRGLQQSASILANAKIQQVVQNSQEKRWQQQQAKEDARQKVLDKRYQDETAYRQGLDEKRLAHEKDELAYRRESEQLKRLETSIARKLGEFESAEAKVVQDFQDGLIQPAEGETPQEAFAKRIAPIHNARNIFKREMAGGNGELLSKSIFKDWMKEAQQLNVDGPDQDIDIAKNDTDKVPSPDEVLSDMPKLASTPGAKVEDSNLPAHLQKNLSRAKRRSLKGNKEAWEERRVFKSLEDMPPANRQRLIEYLQSDNPPGWLTSTNVGRSQSRRLTRDQKDLRKLYKIYKPQQTLVLAMNQYLTDGAQLASN